MARGQDNAIAMGKDKSNCGTHTPCGHLNSSNYWLRFVGQAYFAKGVMAIYFLLWLGTKRKATAVAVAFRNQKGFLITTEECYKND